MYIAIIKIIIAIKKMTVISNNNDNTCVNNSQNLQS